MSGDRAQKNFDPTPARKQKAKRDGNVARSSELSAIVAFAGAAAATFATTPLLVASAADGFRGLARRPDPAHVPAAVVTLVALGCLPAGAAAVGAIGANLAQAGGLHFKLPTFGLTRLNPVAGLKRMFGAEAAIGALRALVAFAVAAIALAPLGPELIARVGTSAGPGAFIALANAGAGRAFAAAVGVGAAFALADYAIVRRRWLRELRMTLEEFRRDQKENDGDPHTRSRRKSLHRSLVRGALGRTREASFVVVNPTHVAIAVRYAPPDILVPEIVVRAADEAAQRVRALAALHAIPVVEDIPLARALYAQGEAGRPIPTATYVAVARVIAELVRAGIIIGGTA